MATLNGKGWELFDKWGRIHEQELERIRREKNDPDWVEGWCIIDDYDHVKTLDDEVGLLIFGYDEGLDRYFDEWRDVYGDDPAYFVDADGRGYTLNEVEQACAPYYDNLLPMTLTRLIAVLQDALKENGEMKISVCANGTIYPDVEINCTDDTLYIEGYR